MRRATDRRQPEARVCASSRGWCVTIRASMRTVRICVWIYARVSVRVRSAKRAVCRSRSQNEEVHDCSAFLAKAERKADGEASRRRGCRRHQRLHTALMRRRGAWLSASRLGHHREQDVTHQHRVRVRYVQPAVTIHILGSSGGTCGVSATTTLHQETAGRQPAALAHAPAAATACSATHVWPASPR